MRILVLSDSHGCVDPMQQCVELVQPQAILHLGDCARDADRLGGRTGSWAAQAVADSSRTAAKSADRNFFMLVTS